MSFNVGTAFERFCSSLKMSEYDQKAISMRYHSITRRINNDYWDSSSDITHSLYVGSYGRDTEIFSSDIDMLIQLPYSYSFKILKVGAFCGIIIIANDMSAKTDMTYCIMYLKINQIH